LTEAFNGASRTKGLARHRSFLAPAENTTSKRSDNGEDGGYPISGFYVKLIGLERRPTNIATCRTSK